MELFFLGTGGSVATLERDNTAFLLETKDALVMIDCPGSVVQKVKRAGRRPREIGAVLLSHVHPDHVYGLPSLVHSLMLEEIRIDVYASPEGTEFCARLLDLFALREERIRCRIRFQPVEDGRELGVVPGWRCTAFRVPHSPASLAFHFQSETRRVQWIYSGDTPVHPPLFRRARGTDWLIHDCSAPSRFFREYPSLREMHTDSLSLGRMAQEAGVKHLVPCHFFGEIEYPLEEIEKEIREHFRGDLILPRDFSRIVLE